MRNDNSEFVVFCALLCAFMSLLLFVFNSFGLINIGIFLVLSPIWIFYSLLIIACIMVYLRK